MTNKIFINPVEEVIAKVKRTGTQERREIDKTATNANAKARGRSEQQCILNEDRRSMEKQLL